MSPEGPDHSTDDAAVEVRVPTAMDQLELQGLAHRVGETVPEQPVVVAAVDGHLVGALSVRTGVLVHDRDGAPACLGDALRSFARDAPPSVAGPRPSRRWRD